MRDNSGRSEEEVELLKSLEFLNSPEGEPLRSVLLSKFGSIEHAFITSSTPEQCEDIYEVVLDGERLALIEIDRNTRPFPIASAIVEIHDPATYRRKLAKRHKRKIETALQMISKLQNK